MTSMTTAQRLRELVLNTISEAGLGHVGGDLSIADILSVLFTDVLRFDPNDPTWVDRDRLVVSKGHAAVSLYSALAVHGYFEESELSTFAAPMSRLNGHPANTKLPGIETSTGPLGHGLPIAVGMAIGARIRNQQWRTYVVTGDGELQEGSNWEAAMLAGHRKLSNLTLVVDRNGIQQGAPTEETNALEPLGDKFAAFGWDVRDIDGHDHDLMREALIEPSNHPVAVIARTVKGKGVSFMENEAVWHHKVPSAEQTSAALLEIAGSR